VEFLKSSRWTRWLRRGAVSWKGGEVFPLPLRREAARSLRRGGFLENAAGVRSIRIVRPGDLGARFMAED